MARKKQKGGVADGKSWVRKWRHAVHEKEIKKETQKRKGHCSSNELKKDTNLGLKVH